MGQKPPHAVVITLLLQWLVQGFDIRFVRMQSTINVDEATGYTNEPEPDAVVTVKSMLHYLTHHPTPAELHLVVEVSDTTLNFDLTTKADLYARAAIADYWVLDVNGRRIWRIAILRRKAIKQSSLTLRTRCYPRFPVPMFPLPSPICCRLHNRLILPSPVRRGVGVRSLSQVQ